MRVSPNTMFCRDWSFTEETYESYSARYTGFANDLYAKIQEQLPSVFSQLRFYQSDLHQQGDSYAIYESSRPFSIQIDPDCEVIVLGGDKAGTEIGAWFDEPCKEAIRFIRDNLIN